MTLQMLNLKTWLTAAHLCASGVQQHVCNARLEPAPAGRVKAPVPVTRLPARRADTTLAHPYMYYI